MNYLILINISKSLWITHTTTPTFLLRKTAKIFKEKAQRTLKIKPKVLVHNLMNSQFIQLLLPYFIRILIIVNERLYRIQSSYVQYDSLFITLILIIRVISFLSIIIYHCRIFFFSLKKLNFFNLNTIFYYLNFN